MKFSQITLRAPSPSTRDPRFTSDKYDIEAKDGLITARPLAGGPTLVWAYSNFSEAVLLTDEATRPMTDLEQEMLRLAQEQRLKLNVDGSPHKVLEIKPTVEVPSPAPQLSRFLDTPPVTMTAQQPAHGKHNKYRR